MLHVRRNYAASDRGRHRGDRDHRRLGDLRRADPKRLALTDPGGGSPAWSPCAAGAVRWAAGGAAVASTVGVGPLGIRDGARSDHRGGDPAAGERKPRAGRDRPRRRNMMNGCASATARSSLMTPRTDIAWLDVAAPLADNLATMQEPVSRYPSTAAAMPTSPAGPPEVNAARQELGDQPNLFATCPCRCSCPSPPMR